MRASFPWLGLAIIACRVVCGPTRAKHKTASAQTVRVPMFPTRDCVGIGPADRIIIRNERKTNSGEGMKAVFSVNVSPPPYATVWFTCHDATDCVSVGADLLENRCDVCSPNHNLVRFIAFVYDECHRANTTCLMVSCGVRGTDTLFQEFDEKGELVATMTFDRFGIAFDRYDAVAHRMYVYDSTTQHCAHQQISTDMLTALVFSNRITSVPTETRGITPWLNAFNQSINKRFI